MASNIDPTVPIYGKPTTQSVRTNFQYAHDEITVLQNWQGTIGNGPFALKAGDTFTGPVLLGHGGTPNQASEAVSKSYVDGRIGTVQSITAGTGLTGGTITSSGTIGVNFGSTTGTVAQGNDARFANIPAPANAPPPATGAAAIGSSPNYARQDHNHASDVSRVAKAGDTMSGGLTAAGLRSTGDLTVDANIYISGTAGIKYAGSNWIRFGWNGNLNVYIDGGYAIDAASTSWVNNNFATYGYVQNNYQTIGSHYIPNQNVDYNSSPNFWDCHVNGSYLICQNNSSGVRYASGAYSTNNTFLFGYNNVVAGAATISIDNGNAGYALGNISDERIKMDIAPSKFDCLDVINKIDLYEYRWRDIDAHFKPLDVTRKNSEMVRVGMIAQRLYKLIPEATVRGEDRDDKLGLMWTIDTNVMLSLLAGGMQQLVKRVEQLESKS